MRSRRAKIPVAYASQNHVYAFYNSNGFRGLIQLCRIPNPFETTAVMWGVKVAAHSIPIEKGTTVSTFGEVTIQPHPIGKKSEWQAMLVYVKGVGAATHVMYPAWPKHTFKAAGPFINHSSTHANVRLVRSSHGVRFVATKRILANEPVLTKYGAHYARLLKQYECQ